MKKIRNSKGITLIALVITIIVLLILAGVSLSLVMGNEGILRKAETAKEKTDLAQIEERAKLDIFSLQAENEGKNISKEQLKGVLQKYFNDVPEELPDDVSDLELTAKGEFGGQKIKVSSIYKGSFADKTGGSEGSGGNETITQLAKDVLVTNPSAEDMTEKSPYVQYNGMLCRVLYDASSEYGLQIITADNIEMLHLGTGDEAITEPDFNYTGSATIDDDFRKAASSYNNAINTLNNRAKRYMDTKGIAQNARCLGSSPMYATDSSSMYSGTYSYLGTYGWNNVLKNTDTNYTTDIAQVNALGLNLNEGRTWVASREVLPNTDFISFDIRVLDVTGELVVGYDVLVFMNKYGLARSYDTNHGFRPVFSLSSDTKIIAGNGTSGSPYVLSL